MTLLLVAVLLGLLLCSLAPSKLGRSLAAAAAAAFGFLGAELPFGCARFVAFRFGAELLLLPPLLLLCLAGFGWEARALAMVADTLGCCLAGLPGSASAVLGVRTSAPVTGSGTSAAAS